MVIDVGLVASAKRGDKKAFEKLYTQIYKDLYRYAFYMLKNSQDAEDIVSDTICDVYRYISSLKQDESFFSWTIKILSTKCKMKRKEYINAVEQYDESAENIISNSLTNSHEFASSALTRCDLINVLNCLCDEDKEIIILSAVFCYNSKEIGEIINMNPNTVRSRLNRALEKVKERMIAYENK